MENLRWGIMSTADIGMAKVIPAIQQAERCTVVAIASRDGAVARAAADELGIPDAYGSYEELLAAPDVDAVYIPLPNHLHAEWTKTAAAAGKHVLCEKPLALTADEAQGMVDACAEAGVVFMEAFMYRLHPTWVAALELVRSGRIGDLVSMQIWFSYFNDDPDNIRNNPQIGGGTLMDIGCYGINAARLILGGEPSRVAASITRDPTMGVDIVTSAILEFGDVPATFTVSTRCETDQRVDIYGTRGRISIEIPFNIPWDQPTRVFVVAGGEPPTDPGTEVLTFPSANQYSIEAEVFARSVLDGVPLPYSPEDGVANMRVIEQIVAAAS
jgi:predicted dehydrogenase